MKIYIKCKSILLQKALDVFIADYKTTSLKDYEIVISDYMLKTKKFLFLIERDIKKPFSREQIIIKLKKFHKSKYQNINEDKIKLLLEEYTRKITLELNKKNIKYA